MVDESSFLGPLNREMVTMIKEDLKNKKFLYRVFKIDSSEASTFEDIVEFDTATSVSECDSIKCMASKMLELYTSKTPSIIVVNFGNLEKVIADTTLEHPYKKLNSIRRVAFVITIHVPTASARQKMGISLALTTLSKTENDLSLPTKRHITFDSEEDFTEEKILESITSKIGYIQLTR